MPSPIPRTAPRSAATKTPTTTWCFAPETVFRRDQLDPASHSIVSYRTAELDELRELVQKIDFAPPSAKLSAALDDPKAELISISLADERYGMAEGWDVVWARIEQDLERAGISYRLYSQSGRTIVLHVYGRTKAAASVVAVQPEVAYVNAYYQPNFD